MTRDSRVTIISREERAPLDFIISVGKTSKQANWTSSVEVRGFDGKPPRRFPPNLSKRQLDFIRDSNRPAFFLVVDVREERFYFAWISTPQGDTRELETSRPIQLTEIDDDGFTARIDEIRHAYQKSKSRASQLVGVVH